MIQKRPSPLVISTSMACLFAATAQAGVSSTNAAGKNSIQNTAAKEESACDKIWGLATLYKNDHNSFLEELSLTGRYQGQFYSVDGDKSSDSDWENRRFRLGLKAKLFDKHLEFKGEMYSNLVSEEDFYAGLKNFNLTYKFSEAFNVTVGKFEPNFGYYYSKSDTLMLPFERSALTNQLKNEYGTGINVSGKVDKLGYYVSATSNTPDKEFGNFDGGWASVAGISYDLKAQFGLEKALLHLEYLHSEHNAKDTVLTGFDNAVTTYLELKQGGLGLATEVMAGFGTSNAVGLMLEPTYDLTQQLQLVGRYQLAFSDDAQGLNPNKRYESKVGAGKGDIYNAAYLGLNYYICGQKLKLMSGLEYATMSGGDSTWTWLGGVRVFW